MKNLLKVSGVFIPVVVIWYVAEILGYFMYYFTYRLGEQFITYPTAEEAKLFSFTLFY